MKRKKSALIWLRERIIPREQRPRQIAMNLGITAALLLAAALVCAVMNALDKNDSAIPLVFVLAVLVTARLTEGYLYSIIAASISVVGVNYAFTYPYFEFNFTITGYPLTFLAMFTVSLVVGMLTEQVKRQGRIEAEAEKEKMKANLLRSVSHDLRTPLTAIIGSATVVLDHYDQLDDSAKKELIGHVRDDAQWLVRLVENMLSITRINEGAVRIDKNPEAVEEIVSEAVANFRKRAAQMDIRVSVPQELLMVPMDATLIEQVLINLMDNVLSHAQTATRIELSVTHDGKNAVFTVSDNGLGIDECVLSRLFDEMFPHAQEPRGDGRRDMGIGLFVCKSIVRAHGGEMSACNLPQGGACVSFTLPEEEEI